MSNQERVAERRKHWGELIARQQQSGKTVKAFCEEMQPLQPHSISTSRKIDFERTIRRTTKPPARAGGFVQFANKVLIALP